MLPTRNVLLIERSTLQAPTMNGQTNKVVQKISVATVRLKAMTLHGVRVLILALDTSNYCEPMGLLTSLS